MEKRTIENLVDYIILEELKKTDILTDNDVVKIAEKLADNFKDYEDILGIVGKTKRYNLVIDKAGNGWIFGTSEQQVRDFVDSEVLRDDDPCWTDYIVCDGHSYKLNYFVEVE